jgi:hypothetical protein
MIMGIRSYSAGIVSSVLASVKAENNLQVSSGQGLHDSAKVKPSPDGATRPMLSSGDVSLTLAGSVVYEPAGLLADLSGAGPARKAADLPPRAVPAGAYEKASLTLLQGGEEPAYQPVLHTFEIIV